MTCPECGQPLKIANSRLESEKDSTDVYSVFTMVCVNSKIDPLTRKQVCSMFCGPDLNNPRKVAKVVRRKVN